MPIFNGTARKVALLPIIFLLPGWITYVVGFAMLIVILSGESKPLKGPVYYDIYATLVGGPFLCISSVFHAGLPGIASAIVGGLSAALSVFYFLSAGSVMLKAGERIYNATHHNISKDQSSIIAYECMFGGILLLTLCWTIILMLSLCYKTRGRGNESIFYYSAETERPQRPWFVGFAGIARKIAIPFVILSFAGWVVFIYGVHLMPMTHSYSFPYDLGYWGAILPALLLYLAALLHAWCSNNVASIMLGIFTSLLSMLFLVCMGQVIHQVGINIFCRGELTGTACPPEPTTIPAWRIWQFSGGLAACVFWACVLILWPFYKNSSTLNRHHSVHHVNYDSLQTARGNDFESMSLLSKQRT